MNKYIYIKIVLFLFFIAGSMACKKQLDIGNPNDPSLKGNVVNETGIISLAKGIYINGFKNGDDWLGDSYFSLPYGYSEIMADVVGADASNNQVSTMGVPDYLILDNGTKLINPSPQVNIIRKFNTRPNTGNANNALYYQWLNMYALNNTCNVVLRYVNTIKYSGDSTTKANTIKAWCYWWKGYAYSSIGSMYYSGLISDSTDESAANYISKTNNNYLLHDKIIARSNFYYNKASDILKNGILSTSDFSSILAQLIPDVNKVGNGGVLTTDMWIRNINTMLARNILLNNLAPFVNKDPNAIIAKSSISTMTTSNWNDVLNLASTGITSTDLVFTGRSAATNYIFSATGGTVSAKTGGGPNTSTTFKVTERFIQNFKIGDLRKSNNFNTKTTYKNSFNYTTRYTPIDGGNGLIGVYTYVNRTAGAYELFIAGSYEENQLMLAEANIRLGNIDVGLGYIDAVRTYQGSGLSAVASTGLNLSDAMQELVQERRVALVYRGLSFYDNRRWGWIYDISKGGGSYNNTVVMVDGTVNVKAIINYNFMDYWDIPADETVLNPPSSSSAPVVNPNF